MSYNLVGEGCLDMSELAAFSRSAAPLFLFPLVSDSAPRGLDAVGVSVPASAAAACVRPVESFVRLVWSLEGTVYDLYTGEAVRTEGDLAALLGRIAGLARPNAVPSARDAHADVVTACPCPCPCPKFEWRKRRKPRRQPTLRHRRR
jgi:hypothetical protein